MFSCENLMEIYCLQVIAIDYFIANLVDGFVRYDLRFVVWVYLILVKSNKINVLRENVYWNYRRNRHS